MTTVAWDGETLCADRRATCGSAVYSTTKIRAIKRPGFIPEVLAWMGEQDSGEWVAKWYEEGADPAKWPACQNDKEIWSRLIVANAHGCRFFERQPIAVRVEDAFAAWGSGRDFAVAAMHCGKTAREAVEIACLYDSGSGNGVDAVTLR